jgi:hypothetical protein
LESTVFPIPITIIFFAILPWLVQKVWYRECKQVNDMWQYDSSGTF